MYFLLTCQHSRFMKCFIHFALQGIMWMWIWLIGMMIWMMCIWEWYELFNDVDMECKSKSIKNTVSQVIFCYLRVCVCIYILSLWRLLPTARCPRHTLRVRINDLVLWILVGCFLPSSFISISENVIFHLQSPARRQTGEKRYDILGTQKDDMNWYRI